MKMGRIRSIQKRLLILAVFTFAAGLLGAASIEVTYPGGASAWHNGQTYTIQWTKAGNMPGYVKVSLRNSASTEQIVLIKDSTANDGSCPWQVPLNLPLGTYRIRVKAKNSEIMGDSAPFRILPEWNVTYPIASQRTVWRKNKTYTITWGWKGPTPSAPVVLGLYKKVNNQFELARNIGSSAGGSFPWTVPADLPLGDYSIFFDLENESYRTLRDIKIVLTTIPGPLHYKK